MSSSAVVDSPITSNTLIAELYLHLANFPLPSKKEEESGRDSATDIL